jgi:hypothetical protein
VGSSEVRRRCGGCAAVKVVARRGFFPRVAAVLFPLRRRRVSGCSWRRGAVKPDGVRGAATLVETRPSRGGGGAPAMAASLGLARLRWAWAGLAGLACYSRLRVVPGRLLGVVVAPVSSQATAAAGSPPSSPVSVDRWIEVGRWSALLLRAVFSGSPLSVGEPKGDSLQRV